MDIIWAILELFGVTWEAASDSQSDETPRVISGCVSLFLLFVIAIVISIAFYSGKLTW